MVLSAPFWYWMVAWLSVGTASKASPTMIRAPSCTCTVASLGLFSQAIALIQPCSMAPVESPGARLNVCQSLSLLVLDGCAASAAAPTAQCIATAVTHSRAWMHTQHFAHGARIGRRWRQPWRSCSRKLGRWWLGLACIAVWFNIAPALRIHPVRCTSPESTVRVACLGQHIFKLFLQRSASMPDATCLFIDGAVLCQHNPTAAVRHATGAHIRHSIHTLRCIATKKSSCW